MKRFIFVPVVLFVIQFLFTGCYTYLSLSNGAKLAVGPYDEFDSLETGPEGPPPPPCIDCGWPAPPSEPILTQYIPPSPPYERSKEITDIRNSDGSRNSDNNGRKR